jgi:hypothetical protein
MNNRDLLNLVPQSTINSALRKDAEVLSSNTQAFINSNRSIYELAVNSWLLSWKHYCPYTWTTVASRIASDGLTATVAYFKEAADLYVNGADLIEYPLAKSAYREITLSMVAPRLMTEVYATNQSAEGIFLFLCRFLKRITPIGADKLATKAVRDFKQVQNRQKLIGRRGYNPLILSLVKKEVNTRLLKRRCKVFKNILMADIELTPGVCYDLRGRRLNCTGDKLQSLVTDYNYERMEVYSSSVWLYELGDTAYLTTVPKTLSAARTIAPEQCLRQAIAHRMFTLCNETYPGINLHDQTPNQQYARDGSVSGEWSTIDLSHASDDVSWTLVQEIFSDVPEYLRYLGFIRPKYVNIDGENLLLQSFATMGNSFTFINETEIFYLITKAAVHFAQRYEGDFDDTVIVYGDDILCHTRAYPYVIAFLEKLGFSPNESKSFSGGPGFRESCGKDFIKGLDVSSPYFPRRPLKNLLSFTRTRDGELITTAESLIALQHRLLDVAPEAAQYVELFIRDQVPGLGCALVGTQTLDLWGYDTVYCGCRYIPEGEWETKRTVQHIAGLEWVKEKRILKRAVVKDDVHRVNLQLRPSIEVQPGFTNDEILYHEYLAKGPFYATSLDRQLGISTSRCFLPTGKPIASWLKFEV